MPRLSPILLIAIIFSALKTSMVDVSGSMALEEKAA
jgi:hypothetical protein